MINHRSVLMDQPVIPGQQIRQDRFERVVLAESRRHEHVFRVLPNQLIDLLENQVNLIRAIAGQSQDSGRVGGRKRVDGFEDLPNIDNAHSSSAKPVRRLLWRRVIDIMQRRADLQRGKLLIDQNEGHVCAGGSVFGE